MADVFISYAREDLAAAPYEVDERATGIGLHPHHVDVVGSGHLVPRVRHRAQLEAPALLCVVDDFRHGVG